MQVRVEAALEEGEHKASPLLCYGFAIRGVHGGKGTFLSLHLENSRSVSFPTKSYMVGVFRNRNSTRISVLHYCQYEIAQAPFLLPW